MTSEEIDEKSKILRPKPAIATKPKYVPPVNLKVIPKTDHRSNGREELKILKNEDLINIGIIKNEEIRHGILKNDRNPGILKNIDYKHFDEKNIGLLKNEPKKEEVHRTEPIRHHPLKTQTQVKVSSIRSKNGREEFKVSKTEKIGAPNSPSTVCCSILSNTSDCCNLMGKQKKEIDSKSMSKIDSLDSNSSDSGGFREFIQLDKKLSLEPDKKPERKYDGHIRKFSQPEFLDKTIAEKTKVLSQCLCERKSSEHIFKEEEKRQIIYQDKKSLPHLITQTQFKQNTKKLEEMLAQRLDSENQKHKRAASCHESETSSQYEQQMKIQKDFQHKLKADLQQTVKHIQEIQSTELRLPQNRSWNDVRITKLKFLVHKFNKRCHYK